MRLWFIHNPSCLEMLQACACVIPSFRISSQYIKHAFGKHTKLLVAKMFLTCASRRESVGKRCVPEWRDRMCFRFHWWIWRCSADLKCVQLYEHLLVSVNVSVSHCFTSCSWMTMTLWCGQQVSNMCVARKKLGHNLKAMPVLSMAVAVATLLISVTFHQLIRSLQSGLAFPVARCFRPSLSSRMNVTPDGFELISKLVRANSECFVLIDATLRRFGEAMSGFDPIAESTGIVVRSSCARLCVCMLCGTLKSEERHIRARQSGGFVPTCIGRRYEVSDARHDNRGNQLKHG